MRHIWLLSLFILWLPVIASAQTPCSNPISFMATVEKPSKCGRNTGQASFTVTGGSGQYAYSLGGTTVTGLGPGDQFGIVQDNVTGCIDTAFFNIPVVTAEGNVTITVRQPRCAGGLGNIEVNLEAGNNFALPYTFHITKTDGTPVPQADNLSAGDYLVYVADADSCVLPAQPFTMSIPDPIQTNAVVTPGNCMEGGEILITANGGTGVLIADWLDVISPMNNFSRNHLLKGKYNVIVYDSLFCKDTLSDIIVKSTCTQRDTVALLVAKNSNNAYCTKGYPGLALFESEYTLLNPSNASAFGNWSLQDNCLTYTALQTTGLDVDVICIKIFTPSLNQTDTVCVSVSIISEMPTAETVYFTAQINSATAACGTIPSFLTNRTIIPLNVANLNGLTAYANYTLNNVDACINYTPFDTPQFFADSIAVGVCDKASLKCHIIRYVPSILPFFDCSKGILGLDSIILPTVDCLVGANVCVEIPYADILNYNIFDNSEPYTKGALGCLETTVQSYPVAQLPGLGNQNNGPYYLNEWFVNGIPHTGLFGDIGELLLLMNRIDPIPGWYLENATNIIGGNIVNTYGPLRISRTNNEVKQIQPALKTAALGTELRFSTGEHFVILKKIQTGCADTIKVKIPCNNCPPVYPYTPDMLGNISWTAALCSNDTLFQTNIPFSSADSWQFYDNKNPIVNPGESNGAVAFVLDTGYHQLQMLNTITTCAYEVPFYLNCKDEPIDTTNSDRVVIFNGISPNGDGKNDIWLIGGIADFPGNEVWVYNRYGNEVFHQKQYENNWSGTWNDKTLPSGSYYYVVDLGNGSKVLKGYLEISY
jgi:gliding motility-associated-like protein